MALYIVTEVVLLLVIVATLNIDLDDIVLVIEGVPEAEEDMSDIGIVFVDLEMSLKKRSMPLISNFLMQNGKVRGVFSHFPNQTLTTRTIVDVV